MKNKILKGVTKASVIAFIVSGCALDSNSMIPAIISVISAAWIILIVAANTRG